MLAWLMCKWQFEIDYEAAKYGLGQNFCMRQCISNSDIITMIVSNSSACSVSI